MQSKSQRKQEKLKALIMEVARVEKENRDQKEQNKEILQLLKQKLLLEQQEQRKHLQVVYRINNTQQKNNIKANKHKSKKATAKKDTAKQQKQQQIIQTVKLLKPQQNIQIQQQNQINDEIFKTLTKIQDNTEELKQITQNNNQDEQNSIKEIVLKIQEQISKDKINQSLMESQKQMQLKSEFAEKQIEEEKKHMNAYNKLAKNGDASYTHKSLIASNNSSFSSSGLYSDSKPTKQVQDQNNQHLIKQTVEHTINQLIPQIAQIKIENQLQQIQQLLQTKLEQDAGLLKTQQEIQQNTQINTQENQQIDINNLVNTVKEQVIQELQPQLNIVSQSVSNTQQPQITYVTDQEPIFDFQVPDNEKSSREANRPKAREGLRRQENINIDRPQVELTTNTAETAVDLPPQVIDEQNKQDQQLVELQQKQYQELEEQLKKKDEQIQNQIQEFEKEKQEQEKQQQQLIEEKKKVEQTLKEQEEQYQIQLKKQKQIELENQKQSEEIQYHQELLFQQQQQIDMIIDQPFYNYQVNYQHENINIIKQFIQEKSCNSIQLPQLEEKTQSQDYIEEVISLQSTTQEQNQQIEEKQENEKQEEIKDMTEEKQVQQQVQEQPQEQPEDQQTKQEEKEIQKEEKVEEEKEKEIKTLDQLPNHFVFTQKGNMQLEQKYQSSLYTQYQKSMMGDGSDFYVQEHLAREEQYLHITDVLAKLLYHYNEDIELFDNEFSKISKSTNLIAIIDLMLYYLHINNVIIETQDGQKQVNVYEDIQNLNDTMDLNSIKLNIDEQQFRDLCMQCYNQYINKQTSIQSATYHALTQLNSQQQSQKDIDQQADKLLMQLLQQVYNEQNNN